MQSKIGGGDNMQQESEERIEMIGRGEIPDGYKKTKVGIIPNEWEFKKIGSISSKITDGTHDTPKPVEKGIPFITAIHVKDRKINFDECYYLSRDVHDVIYKRCNPEKDDLLIVNIGAGTATPALVHADYEFSMKNIALIKPNRDIINPKYLEQFLLNSKSWLFYRVTSGGAQPFLSLKEICNLLIAIPNINEQQKIATTLSIWDTAIDLKEKLITQKQEQKKGLMQNLLTGRARVNEIGSVNSKKIRERIAMIHRGEVPEGYKKTKIGIMPIDWRIEKAKAIFRNISIKNNGDEELLSVTQDRGVLPRSILGQRVMMPEGDTQSYKLVLPNQYIISLRSFEGGIELSNYRGVVSPAYTVLENIKEIDYNFYKYLFKKEDFIRRMSSTVIGIRDGKQISYSDFAELFIQSPDVNEQKEISIIIALSDTELHLLTQELAQLKQQKKSLMQLLLTGIVRVKY